MSNTLASAKHYQQKGFTLIELVLVISLLVISVGVSSDVILSIVRSYNKTQITSELEQSANYALLKIQKELRDASSVSVPNATVSNTLTFVDQNSLPVQYQLSGTVLQRVFNGQTYAMTNNATIGGVTVSCPSSCYSRVGTTLPYVVKINMLFTSTNSTDSVLLDSTVVVRGTY